MSLRLPLPKRYDYQRALEEDPSDSEPQLLRRIADGDTAAFWKIWEAYQQYLYTLCHPRSPELIAIAIRSDGLSRQDGMCISFGPFGQKRRS